MVCPDWFPFSAGLAQSCYDICKQLESRDHTVKIIVAKDPNVDKKGLDVIEIPYLIRLIGRNPVVCGFWKKIRKHIEWSDSVCLFSYMYLMNAQIVKMRKKGKFDKPLIHFYRGSLESNSLKHLSTITKFAKKIYDATYGKIMFTDVDLTISNSEPTLDVIKERYNVADEKLKYIPSALNVNNFPKWSKEHKRVVFIGRLIDNKGIGLFENIIKQIPVDWKFTIIGSGPMIKEVLTLAKKYEQIEYKGKITHSKTKEMLSKSDILVLPTFAEGSPRVVIEASACGVPSISFNVGDVVNTIPKGAGYAIDPFDIDKFCSRLKELIEDADKRQKMGIAARKYAQSIDWEKIYPKIEAALRKE